MVKLLILLFSFSPPQVFLHIDALYRHCCGMGLLMFMTAMDNLHNSVLNIHVHTPVTEEESCMLQLCHCPHQHACCVADKGVSNSERLGMLRFPAATASSTHSLMFLMPLWHKPHIGSSTGESTDALYAPCTSIAPAVKSRPTVWRKNPMLWNRVCFCYCNVKGWQSSRYIGSKVPEKLL